MSGTVINRALYKLAEYGVRRLRARFEFRVELHADVKLVFGDFNRLNKSAVLGYADANSSEFNPNSKHCVIDLMPDQHGVKMGFRLRPLRSFYNFRGSFLRCQPT